MLKALDNVSRCQATISKNQTKDRNVLKELAEEFQEIRQNVQAIAGMKLARRSILEGKLPFQDIATIREVMENTEMKTDLIQV